MSYKKHLLDHAEVNDKRHQSLLLPTTMAEEVAVEAKRLDRSRSYIPQLAWKVARNRIRQNPSAL